MKRIAILFLLLTWEIAASAQTTVDGEKLLELIGRPVSDPLFQQLKNQESFFTDAWDMGLTIYITKDSADIIRQVELQNGKLKYNSTSRYGHYKGKLPLQLHWGATADIEKKLGKPTLISTSMGFKDYSTDNWKLRIFYENDSAVSIAFNAVNEKKTSVTNATPITQSPVAVATTPARPAATDAWVIRIDTNHAKASLNWNALRTLLVSTDNLSSLTGTDSTDYIGQVYYNTPYKAMGFERTAIKRKKQNNSWTYEAFFKIAGDSNKARDVFFALYDEIKDVMKKNTADDFILASSAAKAISDVPVNWLAQWTLYSRYKGLVPGLGKVQVILLMTGSNNFFTKRIDYTFKFYVVDKSAPIDFFTWDKPRD